MGLKTVIKLFILYLFYGMPFPRAKGKNAAYNPAYEAIRNNMRLELEKYLTATGDLHMIGNGMAYEDFPLSQDLDRGISYSKPTEAYIDELPGEPITE